MPGGDLLPSHGARRCWAREVNPGCQKCMKENIMHFHSLAWLGAIRAASLVVRGVARASGQIGANPCGGGRACTLPVRSATREGLRGGPAGQAYTLILKAAPGEGRGMAMAAPAGRVGGRPCGPVSGWAAKQIYLHGRGISPTKEANPGVARR